MQKVLPVVLFGLALMIVIIGAGFRHWATQIQENIDSKSKELHETNERISNQIATLHAEGHNLDIQTEEKTIQVPNPKHGMGNSTFREVQIMIPKIIGAAANPEIATLIKGYRTQLDNITEEINNLVEKKKVVENVGGFDKNLVGSLFSLIVLLASLYVILSKSYNAASQKWAFGSTAMILGYWLGG